MYGPCTGMTKWFLGGLFWAIFQLDQFDSTLQMTFDEKLLKFSSFQEIF
jgi:hypothetical protein